MFIFLDTETTGTGPDDRLCQIAFKPEVGPATSELFNPGMPISIDAMANLPGPQPDIKHCPVCKAGLRNVPRSEMKSKGYQRRDDTVSKHTHTYDCASCGNRFEINQDRYLSR